MAIIAPVNGQTLHLGDVTKRQLAQAYNQQSARILELEERLRMLASVLLAILDTPEALRPGVQGTADIDQAVVQNVKPGTQLHIGQIADRYILSQTKPEDAPAVESPRIVLPLGVR